MSQMARVFSDECVRGIEEKSETTKEERRVSGAKAVSVVLLVNIAVAVVIGVMIGEIVLSDIELPAILREFFNRPFSYM